MSAAELARALLQQSVGTSPSINHDLDALAGTWSAEEAEAFDTTVSSMFTIDAHFRHVPGLRVGASLAEFSVP